VTEPAVLLADEPTGNLDSQRSREIMELLSRLNQEHGITIMMVTHEPDMALYAKRIVRFVDGCSIRIPSIRIRSRYRQRCYRRSR
jgi:putative ABC transport system ATP-binding protein